MTATFVAAKPDINNCHGLGCDYCQHLEEQIGQNNKWNSFDFIMGNCLIKRFIGSSGQDIDFYSLVDQLDATINKYIKLFRELKLTSQPSDGNSATNLIRHQLERKAALREVNQRQMDMNKLAEETKMKITLVESEINDSIERCSSNVSNSQIASIRATNDNTNCDDVLKRTTNNVQVLCEQLRSQVALLKAKTLSLELQQSTIR